MIYTTVGGEQVDVVVVSGEVLYVFECISGETFDTSSTYTIEYSPPDETPITYSGCRFMPKDLFGNEWRIELR